jgi:hypothetical protein
MWQSVNVEKVAIWQAKWNPFCVTDDAADEDEEEEAGESPAAPSAAGVARDKPVPFRPSEQTSAYLKDLVAIGVYGKNPTQVVRRLVDEGIRQAIGLGLIERRRP